MAFENLDLDNEPDVDPTPPPQSSNRPFFIILGVLAAVTLLALLGIVGYLALIRPQQVAQRQSRQATVNAQNTQAALIVAQTSTAIFLEMAITPTPTNTPEPLPTIEPTATQTPVLVLPTATTAPTMDVRTATVAALLTQAANVTRTPGGALPTSTRLPETGFAEDVGLPSMMGLAALLIVVIFLARRLRTN